MQIISSWPSPTESETLGLGPSVLYFKPSEWLWCKFKFENHWTKIKSKLCKSNGNKYQQGKKLRKAKSVKNQSGVLDRKPGKASSNGGHLRPLWLLGEAPSRQGTVVQRKWQRDLGNLEWLLGSLNNWSEVNGHNLKAGPVTMALLSTAPSGAQAEAQNSSAPSQGCGLAQRVFKMGINTLVGTKA